MLFERRNNKIKTRGKKKKKQPYTYTQHGRSAYDGQRYNVYCCYYYYGQLKYDFVFFFSFYLLVFYVLNTRRRLFRPSYTYLHYTRAHTHENIYIYIYVCVCVCVCVCVYTSVHKCGPTQLPCWNHSLILTRLPVPRARARAHGTRTQTRGQHFTVTNWYFYMIIRYPILLDT
jgi:hypothetical protein